MYPPRRSNQLNSERMDFQEERRVRPSREDFQLTQFRFLQGVPIRKSALACLLRLMPVGYDRNKTGVRRAVDEKKAVILVEILKDLEAVGCDISAAIKEEKCRPANPCIYYALVEEGDSCLPAADNLVR